MLCLATGALLRVLKQNPGQDIRNLLKGSAQLTEGLIQDFDLNPGLFLESFFPVRMLKGIRYNAISALSEAAKVERFARRQALLPMHGLCACPVDVPGTNEFLVV